MSRFPLTDPQRTFSPLLARVQHHRQEASHILGGLEPSTSGVDVLVVAVGGEASAKGGSAVESSTMPTTLTAITGRGAAGGGLSALFWFPVAGFEAFAGSAFARGGAVLESAPGSVINVSAVAGKATAVGEDSSLFWYGTSVDAIGGQASAIGGNASLDIASLTVSATNGRAKAIGGVASPGGTTSIVFLIATSDALLGDIILGDIELGHHLQGRAHGGTSVTNAPNILVATAGRAQAGGEDSSLFAYTEALDAAYGSATAVGGSAIAASSATTYTAIGGSAIASGGTANPVFGAAPTAVTGRAVANGGVVALTETIVAANGGAIARSGIVSVNDTLLATIGNAFAKGGSVNVTYGGPLTLFATNGNASGIGQSVTLTELLVASSGTATAVGFRCTLTETLVAASGAAITSRGSVVISWTITQVIVTGGRATAFGGVVAAYAGVIFDTEPPLGGIYDRTITGGTFNSGGTGGRIVIPVISGRFATHAMSTEPG